MGTRVLDSSVPIEAGLHVYAHCQPGSPGGVSLLVINTDRTATRILKIPVPGEGYILSADDLQSREVKLNGSVLKVEANDDLPQLAGMAMAPGLVAIAPATITFLILPAAGNGACR